MFTIMQIDKQTDRQTNREIDIPRGDRQMVLPVNVVYGQVSKSVSSR